MKDSHEDALITTRRDFGRKSMQTLLTISLLEHLCSGNLLAKEARLTTEKWLSQVNEIGLSMKDQQLKQTQWQTQVEDLLSNQIDLPELLKLIDFEAIAKNPKLMDNGARSHRPRMPKLQGGPERYVFGQQIFALRKGCSVVPHGHNNMATAFLILKGNFHGRHYDRITDEEKHMIIKPTIDSKFVHWFKAEDEPAFIFNIHVFGVSPKNKKRTSRVYLDPFGEKLDDGLIRARLIDHDEAHKKFG